MHQREFLDTATQEEIERGYLIRETFIQTPDGWVNFPVKVYPTGLAIVHKRKPLEGCFKQVNRKLARAASKS